MFESANRTNILTAIMLGDDEKSIKEKQFFLKIAD